MRRVGRYALVFAIALRSAADMLDTDALGG